LTGPDPDDPNTDPDYLQEHETNRQNDLDQHSGMLQHLYELLVEREPHNEEAWQALDLLRQHHAGRFGEFDHEYEGQNGEFDHDNGYEQNGGFDHDHGNGYDDGHDQNGDYYDEGQDGYGGDPGYDQGHHMHSNGGYDAQYGGYDDGGGYTNKQHYY
jgi:hypothetical protein